MLKGSTKAVLMYRREWSQSSDGVPKTLSLADERPFRETDDVRFKSHWMMLLLNGSLSLFGPGNSAAKWLLLSTSMGTLNGSTARYCDEHCVCGRCWCGAIHIDRPGLFDTDLFYWFRESNVVFVAAIRITQSASAYDNPLFVMFLFLFHAKWTE